MATIRGEEYGRRPRYVPLRARCLPSSVLILLAVPRHGGVMRISGMTTSQSPFASPRRYSGSDLSLLHLVMASTLASTWIPPRSVGTCCCPFAESRPTGVPSDVMISQRSPLVLIRSGSPGCRAASASWVRRRSRLRPAYDRNMSLRLSLTVLLRASGGGSGRHLGASRSTTASQPCRADRNGLVLPLRQRVRVSRALVMAT